MTYVRNPIGGVIARPLSSASVYVDSAATTATVHQFGVGRAMLSGGGAALKRKTIECSIRVSRTLTRFEVDYGPVATCSTV
jgi:hypothetical protein